MKTTDTMAAPPLDTGRRVLPDSARYQWEQQWLRENRAAVRVIGNADSGPASTEPPQAMAAPVVPSQNTSPVATAPLPTTVPDENSSRQPTAPMAAETVLALYRSSAEPTPLIGGHVPTPPRPTPSATQADATTGAAPTTPAVLSSPVESKHFGLWLDDNRVTLSLRLAGEQTQPPELNVLRRWLRGLGLTLQQVIVNGVALWRGPPDAG